MKHYTKESEFQKAVIDSVENNFPGAVVMKQDPTYRQGFPDLGIFLPNGKWALLEVKKSENDWLNHQQPNQDYYISTMNDHGFAEFVYPENFEEVMNELQHYVQEA